MPSLWRLRHAGALDGHRQLLDVGRDGRRPPRLGAGRRRERHPGVITSRANGRVKAARALGEAKERRRTGPLRRRGRGRAARRAGCGIAPVEAFVDDDLGSDRIADELIAAGTTVLRCTTRGAWRRSRRSRTRAAPSACLRANDLPPLIERHAGESRPAPLRRLRPRQPRHAAAQRAGLRPRARGAGRRLRRPALAARRAREHGRALLGARDHAARGAAAAP